VAAKSNGLERNGVNNKKCVDRWYTRNPFQMCDTRKDMVAYFYVAFALLLCLSELPLLVYVTKLRKLVGNHAD